MVIGDACEYALLWQTAFVSTKRRPTFHDITHTAPMIAPTIVLFVLAFLFAIAALNRFISLRSQPSPLYTLVEVIAIYIPISIVFLLPLDILSSNDDGETNHNILYVKPRYILLLWKFDYWSAFVLMWAILPFVQEYYRSGEFTPIARMKDSIKSNLRFQLIVGSVAGVGLTYFFFKFGFTFQTFKDLLIALSHSYSLVLSLWLMSHGLITIPRRRLMSNINLERQLETLYLELPKLHDELNESTYNYKDICSIIQSLQTITGIDQSVFKHEVEALANEAPSQGELDLRSHIRTTQYTSIQQLSHSTLSKLHRSFKSETTNYKSAFYEFDKAKLEILRLEDIIDSKISKTLHFRYGSNLISNGRLNCIVHVFLIPLINVSISIVLFALSFIIVESEVLHSTRLSIINALLSTSRLSATVKFIITFVVLAYMVLCSLISLTRIRLFKMYHVFPRASNPVSVVFFTMYSNRLTVPLSFNFLTLLQSAKVHSIFDELLGSSINLSVLGGFFNTTLPRLIIIPILFASFDVFDRLKKKVSFDYLDAFDSDDETSETNGDQNKRANAIKEGKAIMQRETAPARGGTHDRLYTSIRGSRTVEEDSEPFQLHVNESLEAESAGWSLGDITAWFKKSSGPGDLQIV